MTILLLSCLVVFAASQIRDSYVTDASQFFSSGAFQEDLTIARGLPVCASDGNRTSLIFNSSTPFLQLEMETCESLGLPEMCLTDPREGDGQDSLDRVCSVLSSGHHYQNHGLGFYEFRIRIPMSMAGVGSRIRFMLDSLGVVGGIDWYFDTLSGQTLVLSVSDQSGDSDAVQIPLPYPAIGDGVFHAYGVAVSSTGCVRLYFDAKRIANSCLEPGLARAPRHELNNGFIHVSLVTYWWVTTGRDDFPRGVYEVESFRYIEGAYQHPDDPIRDSLVVTLGAIIGGGSLLGVAVATILFILFFSVCPWCFRRGAWESDDGWAISDMLDSTTDLLDSSRDVDEVLTTFEDIEDDAATENLSQLKLNQDLFTIPFEELRLRTLIGSGGGGCRVYAARWRADIVAIKVFRGSLFPSQKAVDAFEREASMQMSLRHPNIISTFGCCIQLPRLCVIMELCPNSDVSSYLSKPTNPRMKQSEKLRLLSEVCSAMVYLHDSRDIIHRDLKCANIMLSSDVRCRLGDFGLSRFEERSEGVAKTTRVGTRSYMAPEVAVGTSYGSKIDVYSMGIVIYVVMTERIDPYDYMSGELGPGAVELKVAQDPTFRPKVEDPSLFPSWLRGMMEKCWDHDPEARPTFAELGEIFSGKLFGLVKEEDDE